MAEFKRTVQTSNGSGGSKSNENSYDTINLQYPIDLDQAYNGHMIMFFINIPEASKVADTGYATNATSMDSRLVNNLDKSAAGDERRARGGFAVGAAAGTASSIPGSFSSASASTFDAKGRKKKDWLKSAAVAGGKTLAKGALGGVAAGAAATTALNYGVSLSKGYKQLKTAIAMQMPQDLVMSYGAVYSESNVSAMANLINEPAGSGGNAWDSVEMKLARRGLRSAATKVADQLLGDGMSNRLMGEVENPNSEQLFESMKHRTFSFSFLLAPKGPLEVSNVLNIINTFKYHMHPELTTQNYLILPSEFEIEFYSSTTGTPNRFLGRISTCALTGVTVNYTPNGVWSSFGLDEKDAGWTGMPPMIQLSLEFSELDLLTKDRLEGWNEEQAYIGIKGSQTLAAKSARADKKAADEKKGEEMLKQKAADSQPQSPNVQMSDIQAP